MNRLSMSIAAALLGILPVSRAAHAADRYAYIDLQRALEETDDGKKAKSNLKHEFERRQKELDGKSAELKKLKEDFDKKQPLLKPDAAAKAQKDMQDRFLQLQETYTRLQREMQTKEQEATRDIIRRLVAMVGRIAERDHFAMVFERSASVVWALPSLDLTNEVVRMYNSSPASEAKQK